jgi:RHS repeat-associated protein
MKAQTVMRLVFGLMMLIDQGPLPAGAGSAFEHRGLTEGGPSLPAVGAPAPPTAALASTRAPAALRSTLTEDLSCAGDDSFIFLPLIFSPGGSANMAQESEAHADVEPGWRAPVAPLARGDFAAGIAWLHTGERPVQTGLAPEALDPLRAAVVRGRTCGRGRSPLTGVQVSILGHPEYGSTLTQADGSFDLAVNGGGLLVVVYQKAGYLPVQRQVRPPWNDYVLVEDVVLIPLDSQVTVVNLGSDPTMQVVRGSPVSDGDGARQATLLVPPGTTGEVVLPGGGTEPLATASIRATEYTVGDTGPEAMPGDLPPSSRYTYALEYSVDEALGKGALEVRFSQPLIHYVENFLNFPTGMIVPTGYYDRQVGQWKPSENGRVIEIVAVASGLAELDTDGDGVADGGLGISDGERARLATLYQAGQSLWRVPITHFTPWDCNWNGGPPPDAGAPDQAPQPNPLPDQPDCAAGSIIECQGQVLGEALDIVGTPYRLHYRSSRVLGYSAARSLRIPLSGPSVPASLLGIELEIEVAGRRFAERFSAAPNQSTIFMWDGLDAYGQRPARAQPVTVRVGYVYPAVYQEPAQFEAAFGAFSGIPISANPAREEITLWLDWRGLLGGWDARDHGLGGWSLSAHHAYDPIGRVLHLGTGESIGAERFGSSLIQTIGGPATLAQIFHPFHLVVAPDGSVYFANWQNHRVSRIHPDGSIATVAGTGDFGYNGDNQPATQAQLNFPAAVVLGPDGSVYIADSHNHRIRHVDPDGTIHTIAGTGSPGFSGDGGPATQAQLYEPRGLAIGPDGSLYIADRHNHRIRRVSPNGMIYTVAGTDTAGFSGDGGPSTQAQLSNPWDVAIGPDGSLYIADRSNVRIRKVSPDGIMTTVAGNGIASDSGDGGPATLASLASPVAVAVGPDSSLYLTDDSAHRLRVVGPDGVIATLAGTGVGDYSGDGGPAGRASLSTPSGVAIGPDGSVYVSDRLNHRIRRIYSVLPGVSNSDVVIPSADGREIFVFTGSGRHLRTLQALTGAVLYEFGYDAALRLISVTDGSGNTTQVQRTAGGAPSAIVGPDGQATSLTLNAHGYLASVTNPAGETHQLATTAGGLLTSLTNPRGYATLFTYDALGRLIRDQDPAGGDQSLVRTATGQAYSVTITTGLGRATSFHVTTLVDGDQLRVNSLPNDAQVQTVRGLDATFTRLGPSAETEIITFGPDPRWGMLAPVTEGFSRTLPGGLTDERVVTRQAVLADPANPFSLVTLTEIMMRNGAHYSSTYTAATNVFLDRSPAGRVYSTTINSLGQVLLEQPAGLFPTRYIYDSRGRMVSVTVGLGPDARTTLITYNPAGYVASLTDALSRTTTYGYDAAGRLTSETRPDGQVVGYGFDANGNLAGVTPPGRPAHAFAFTPMDQTAQYTPPDVNAGSDATQYTHNVDRQLTLITRPDGQTIAYGYDSAGRRATLSIARGAVSYAYDPVTGNPTSLQAPGGIGLAYGYDGALLTTETWTGPVSGVVERAYNADFRLSALEVNGANSIAYSYDPDGLLSGVGALALSLDPQNGLLLGSALGAVSDTYAYNGFAEPVQYRSLAGGANLLAVDYNRDRLGRITTLSETVGGLTDQSAYTYDLVGRLLTVTKDGSPVETYTYDGNGNRLSFTGTGGLTLGSYDNQDRLTQYGTTTYTYNAAGDRLTRTSGGQVTAYQYDALGNLLAVGLPGGTEITYLVDGHNTRIAKLVNGTRVRAWLYENDLRVIAELDQNNNVVSRFVYGTWSNVPDYLVKGGVAYRLIADHRGSVRLVVNTTTGQTVQRLDYDSFGKVLTDTNPGFQPFGFAGGLYDPDTGLVRFGARDYDPEVGRWTARDPLGFAGGDPNLYAYAGNDPVNGRDPTGLSWATKIPNPFRWISRRWDDAREWWGRKSDLWHECRTQEGGAGAAACLRLICEMPGGTKYGTGEAAKEGLDAAERVGEQYQDRYNDMERQVEEGSK